MPPGKSIARLSQSWTPAKPLDWGFWLGMAGIFAVSLGLRFWGLGRFNTLVFDEVYYAKFASHFLKGELIFTGHPPLSTYIIAIGIWIGERLPWGQDSVRNGLSGLNLAPFSYRWLNAFTGALLPLVVGAIAYQLTRRRSFALVAALLMAADGLFLVESRYALNNIYLVLFGLLGQLGLLLALWAQAGKRWLWLAVAGVCFGASVAIKWNGLGFLLGAYLVWLSAWVLLGIQRLRQRRSPEPTSPTGNLRLDASDFVPASAAPVRSPLQNLTQLHLGHVLVGLALVPALTYYLSWQPYLQLDPGNTFWSLQAQTLDYHHRVGGLTAHPYCSLWFTWLFMLRPIAYFYKTSHAVGAPAPIVGPPLPPASEAVIYDVHAMGNPFLWWLSTAAMFLMIAALVVQVVQPWLTPKPHASIAGTSESAVPLGPTNGLVLYLVLNWLANLLPWMSVSRCLFLYHYMGSLVFAVLALGYLLDRALHQRFERRLLALSAILLILVAFWFWLPLYLGLPLSPEAIQLRRWLPSWV